VLLALTLTPALPLAVPPVIVPALVTVLLLPVQIALLRPLTSAPERLSTMIAPPVMPLAWPVI